jgi:hypothetical protein
MPIARKSGREPLTDPNYHGGQNAAAWQGDQTVGVALWRWAREHTAANSYFGELLSDPNFELSLPPIPFSLEMIHRAKFRLRSART